MDQEKLVLICEDQAEGIFTAVYEGWREGASGREVELRFQPPDDLEFFCTYRRIETDREKAGKVMRTILMRLGTEVYEDICLAAAAGDGDRGTVIFQVLLKALEKGRCRRGIMKALADPDVSRVSKLRGKVWHELHRYYGFLRFRSAGDRGLLIGDISPENDILEFLGPHFADRLHQENWVIYDSRRKKALFHRKGESCVLCREVYKKERNPGEVEQWDEYEELWKLFCGSAAIAHRKNEKLQKQLFPLKYRVDSPARPVRPLGDCGKAQ